MRSALLLLLYAPVFLLTNFFSRPFNVHRTHARTHALLYMFYNRSTRVEIIRERKNERNRVRSTMNILWTRLSAATTRGTSPGGHRPKVFFFLVSFFSSRFSTTRVFFRPPLCRAQTASAAADDYTRPIGFFLFRRFLVRFPPVHAETTTRTRRLPRQTRWPFGWRW